MKSGIDFSVLDMIADNIDNNGAFLWHVTSGNVVGKMALEIIMGPASNITAVKPEWSNFSENFDIFDNETSVVVTTLAPSVHKIASIRTITLTEAPKTSSTATPSATFTPPPIPVQMLSDVSVKFVIGILAGAVGLAAVVITFVYCLSQRAKKSLRRRTKRRESVT